MKKIISIHNSTPHILLSCSCGWQSGGNNNNAEARRELFSHMRKNNCEGASMEVGRISQYRLINTKRGI